MELVEEEGPDALTMRRLASYLGLKPMSLYSHIADKDDLLDAINVRMLEEVQVPQIEGRPPREAIAEGYMNYYSAIRAHPGVASLILRRPTRGDVGAWLELVDLRQRLLEDMGLTKIQAVDAGRSLAVFTVGSLLNDVQAPHRRTGEAVPTPLFDVRKLPHLAAVVDEYIYPDFVRSYRMGLEALLDGFDLLAAKNQAGGPDEE